MPQRSLATAGRMIGMTVMLPFLTCDRTDAKPIESVSCLAELQSAGGLIALDVPFKRRLFASSLN